MTGVARNFAQLAFLLYCAWLIYRSHRVFRSMLLIRMDERDLAYNTRGLLNKLCYFRVRKKMSPLFFLLNLLTLFVFITDLAVQLIFGWFDVTFLAVAVKVFNVTAIFFCGLQAYLAALIDSMLRFEKPFIWYNWDPDGDRIFSSGVLDILLCVVGPLALIVSTCLL